MTQFQQEMQIPDLSRGIAQIQRRLALLTPTLQRNVIRGALAKSGRTMIKELKKRVPRSRKTGSRKKWSQSTKADRAGKKDLFQSIKQIPSAKWRSKSSAAKKGIIGTVVGPSWPQGAHAHLVEWGHDQHIWSDTIQGRRTPQRWMQPAFDAAAPKIRSQQISDMRSGIEKVVNKLAKTVK